MILTPACEDYLKAIYKLRANGETATTQAVAARLDVAAPSATAMIKKLASLKLARHEKYHGVELTPAGEKIALEVIRHHRLIETYLAEVLGLDWDKVHDEAERWEHVLSEEVEAKMAAALGHPTRDPHGAPIPTLDGVVPRDGWQRLSEIGAGATATVRRVSDESAELLRHLQEIDLMPGKKIEVLRATPAEGVLLLSVEGENKTVGLAPAQAIFVELIP